MSRPRLNVTEERELRHLDKLDAAGGRLPVLTGNRHGIEVAGLDARSARALASKMMVELAGGDTVCDITQIGADRLASLRGKQGGGGESR